jgi:DNA-binding CsgD family transcriptional regulator
MPLARRALFEKRPMVVNSVIENPKPTNGYDWELDWPALLYAPVCEPGQRPIGLLVLGCRRDHWYSDDDVAYAGSLGITLAPMVGALRGPLSRLNETEVEIAQLLSYGLSTQEIARAMQTDDETAKGVVETVMRRLRSFSASELRFPLPDSRPRRRAMRM